MRKSKHSAVIPVVLPPEETLPAVVPVEPMPRRPVGVEFEMRIDPRPIYVSLYSALKDTFAELDTPPKRKRLAAPKKKRAKRKPSI
jgi:hypothetical protein